MPKIKPLDESAEKRLAVRAWLLGGMALKDISREALAKRIGMPVSTLGYRIRNPGTLTQEEGWKIMRVIGTPEDLAKALTAD